MRTAVILVLAYILFVHGLGSISLWDPDEPRQVIMAQEMIDRGDYVRPYLNGLPYLEKPPLYSWLIVLTAKVTGKLNEFSSRFPSAVAATLLLLLTYWLGRRLDHEVSGFLSALILATNFQFLGNARESVMDMTFAFFIGLSIFLGYFALEKEKKWLLPIALLPCAFAILTKGPAGLVIPVAVLFLYCLATRRLRNMFFPMTAGVLLSLAVASIWFILAGKAYTDEFLLRQNITRYTTGFDHIEPFTYYFHKLFVNFLPWSIALPFATFFAYRRRLWLPLIWFLFTFIFFEISKSKRAIYLLSCYPACALLVGIYLKERWYVLVEKRWTAALLCIFGTIITILPLFLFPAIPRVPILREMFGHDIIVPAILVGVLVLCGLAFVLSVLKKVPEKSFLALFIYLVLLGFFNHAFYMPAADRSYKSVHLVTKELKDVPRTTPIYTFGFNSASLIHYLGRPIQMLRNPADIALQKDDIILIVEDKPDITNQFERYFSSAKRISYDKDDYVIFVRRDGG
ncbi:MAG: Undecaprenyl phosphate-alpha-4-amino-4-deoxy-L-arabinose arabinosyl transferase [Syntrophorhabdaceae bacterium PtaU1.Bin034]|nr:MAG: Undecaprenyl phosphate-alpha-4-amino-4-deoxy-L-arabinose arabinosyl transferase [Syntrophorhabdaceae bacterium PtaU1.Bin034]